MEIGKMALELPTLECKKCGHTWTPRNPKLPKVCPKCKNPNWNKPKEKEGASQ